MEKAEFFKHRILDIQTDSDFESLALEIFRFQYAANAVYREYCDLIHRTPDKVTDLFSIPFLPVSFFRSHRISSTARPVEAVFSSSGTSGQATSYHNITDLAFYERSFTEGFRLFYGDPKQYCLLALLPSYLERQQSSLVFMADSLIRQTRHADSGFYLYDYEKLSRKLKKLKANGQPSLLLGVSFALIDLVQQYPIDFPELIVMETGGMKGRRKEMIRSELHKELSNGFGVDKIHSEYGMTELLSQAYSKGDGIFDTPPWMRVLIREINDPFALYSKNKSGGINIIDLANIESCAFIEVEDLGRLNDTGQFEVLGRFDHSQARGCNLLIDHANKN
ncbi:MAG: acyltransferase [Bacteroidales bacterium]|nr:acyltransferase [Bacteroidales bacterium]